MVTSQKLSLAFFLFLLLGGLNAQAQDSQTILASEARRFEAMTQADTARLRPMLADDLVYVHSNAMKENKAEHLSAIASRKLVYKKMERQDAAVRFYGKTALVNGTIKVQGILNNNAFEVNLIYLAVYRKKRGIWQLVNWQSTKIP